MKCKYFIGMNGQEEIRILKDIAISETGKTIASNAGGDKALLRAEIHFDNINPLQLLNNRNFNKKFYFRNRSGESSFCGLGSAIQFQGKNEKLSKEAFEDIHQLITDNNVRLYGGIKFDPENSPDNIWEKFGHYYFFLPKFELISDKEQTLVYNKTIGANDKESDIISEISSDFDLFESGISDKSINISNNYRRDDFPGRDTWQQNINNALNIFDHGDAEKIVLSRRSELTFKSISGSTDMFGKLLELNPDAFCFYFSIDDNNIFMGASPERLYSREGNIIKSDALAGTRKRGKTNDEDKSLEAELLNSGKDLEEHAFVLDCIARAYNHICESRNIGAPTGVRKYAKVQHLFNEIKGTLKNNLNDYDIIKALHPTPAVGGIPAKESLRYIREIEQFDRGWYAGPIGWLSRDAAEFAVGIRSGIYKKDRLLLYSGAGIVKGSRPIEEWNEINNKLNNFLRIFDNDNK